MAYVTLSSKAIGSTIKLTVSAGVSETKMPPLVNLALPSEAYIEIRASRPASMTIAATVLGC